MSMTKLVSVGALLGLSVACNMTTTPQEAREDVAEARSDARQDAAEVMKEKDAVDQAQKVAQINEDLAQEHKDAYDGVDPKNSAEHQAGAHHDQDGSVLAGKYERFEALEDETDDAFLRRANATITKVESDLSKVGAAPTQNEDVADAQEAIANAKKSLSEARQKPDDAVFDGKVRVAVAINSAQRHVSEAIEEVKDHHD